MEIKYHLAEIETVANDVAQQISSKIVCLEGEMGAGKTTFIKALCRAWNMIDEVSSPTFSLINEYQNAKNDRIYHFDCYRLSSVEEALDFGAEEYLNSGDLCLIEWSDRIAPLLPANKQNIRLQKLNSNERILTLT